MKPNIIYSPRYRAIIARLVKARKDIGLTQEELSDKLGLKQPEVSRIENYQRQIDLIEFLDWIHITEAADLTSALTALEERNA